MKYGKLLLMINLVAFCVWPYSMQAQIDTNVYRIDLSGHGYLQDVFDAGLRPKRTGSGNSTCQVEDRVINFDLGQNRSATILAATCDFKILSNQALSEVSAWSPPLSLEEARKWMLPISQTYGRSVEELDAFLKNVHAGNSHFGWAGDEKEGFGVGDPRPPRSSGLASMAVRFQNRGRDNKHPIQIALTVDYERPWNELNIHMSPLQPPTGYEQFSMEPENQAPAWLRKGEEPSSYVKALYTPAQIQQMRAEYAAKTGITNPLTPPERREASTPPDATPAPETLPSQKSKWWLWLLPLPLAAAGWLLIRRNPSTD